MDIDEIKKDAEIKFKESCDIIKNFCENKIKKVYANKKNCLLNLTLKERVHLTNENERKDLYLKTTCLPGNKILIEVEDVK